MDETAISLSAKENYLSELGCDYQVLVQSYLVMVDYYVSTMEQTVQMDDPAYYTYVVCKGLENMKNIFRLLLVYTKNKDLAVFQTEKAMIYYAEFIGQISNEHSFIINLTGKDATLFIYKKTLYDVIARDSALTESCKHTIGTMDEFVDTHSFMLDTLFNMEKQGGICKLNQVLRKICDNVDRVVKCRGTIRELFDRVSPHVTTSQLLSLLAAIMKPNAPNMKEDIDADGLRGLSLHRLTRRVLAA